MSKQLINPVIFNINDLKYDMGVYACRSGISITDIFKSAGMSPSFLTNARTSYKTKYDSNEACWGIASEKNYKKALYLFNLKDIYKKPVSEEAKKPKEFNWVDALTSKVEEEKPKDDISKVISLLEDIKELLTKMERSGGF